MSGWVAGALVVGSVGGALIGSSGARGAAQTQADAANRAADLSYEQFLRSQAQQQPFVQAGYGAESNLNYLLGIGPNPNAQASMRNPPSGSATAVPNLDRQVGFNDPNPGNRTATSMGGFPAGRDPADWARNGDQVLGGGYGPAVDPGMYGGMNRGSGGLNGDFMPDGFVGRDGRFGPGGSGSAEPEGPPNSWTTAEGGLNSPEAGAAPGAGTFGSLLSPFTLEQFHQMSPGYQFQRQQGQQGVLNGDASGAGALSGAAQKDLMGFNQGLAETSWNTAFNQYQVQQGNIYDRLSGVANRGQNAAAMQGQTGAALTGQVAQSITNSGSALAAGQVGSANAWAGASSTLGAIPWLVNNMPKKP